MLNACAHLGEYTTQDLRHCRHDLEKEGLFLLEMLATKARGATQQAPEYIPAAFIRRQRTIREGGRERTHVVCDHTEGDVLLGVSTFVGHAGQLLDTTEDGLEQVGVVVAALLLQHGQDALEAHACVDALGRELLQSTVVHAVELHEHVVPQFHEALIACVHTDGKIRPVCGVGLRATTIDVDFGAGPTRTGVAHLPEIGLASKTQDTLRLDAGLFDPDARRFLVGGQTIFLVSAEDGDPQPIFGNAVDLGQQLPRPTDGVFLEVVTERPVAEHLKEGVVVGVHAHFFQVIVLARYADALLRVGRALVVAPAGAQEHILELVHARIREQQGRVILREYRATGDDGVAPRAEKLEETGAYALGGPALFSVSSSGSHRMGTCLV